MTSKKSGLSDTEKAAEEYVLASNRYDYWLVRMPTADRWHEVCFARNNAHMALVHAVTAARKARVAVTKNTKEGAK